ncbi:amidohydrolase family protein [Nonomuraea recticatena]|uniref:amidohydrolase family protein n=1 Tax=Nonomuraea recticatena TaxID=46178 RepID=UPI00361986CB
MEARAAKGPADRGRARARGAVQPVLHPRRGQGRAGEGDGQVRGVARRHFQPPGDPARRGRGQRADGRDRRAGGGQVHRVPDRQPLAGPRGRARQVGARSALRRDQAPSRPARLPAHGPAVRPGVEFAQRTGCPVLTHTYDGSPYNDLPMVDEVAARHPGVVILAGHAGATPLGFDAAIEVAQRRPGVVLEVCGSFNTGADIATMVREVGADRVVYGSDFPFIDLRMSLGRVIFSGLPEEDRAAVLGGTMTRLLQWRSGLG